MFFHSTVNETLCVCVCVCVCARAFVCVCLVYQWMFGNLSPKRSLYLQCAEGLQGNWVPFKNGRIGGLYEILEFFFLIE